MTTAQFESYIDWRTRFRRGEYSVAFNSYTKMYLSGILWSDKIPDNEKTEQVARFIKNYPEFDKSFAQILKDTYICFSAADGGESFESIILRHGLSDFFPEIFIHSDDTRRRAVAISKIGNAGLSRSKFFMPETESLLARTINAVYDKTVEILTERGIKPDEIFFERTVSDYRLFERGILFYPPALPPGKVLKLTEAESYKADRFQNFTKTEIAPERKLFPLICSYIVKETEAALRGALCFKGKASGSPNFVSRFNAKMESKFANFFYNHPREKLWKTAAEYLCSEDFPVMLRVTVLSILKNEYADLKLPEKIRTVPRYKYTPEPEVFVPIEVKVDFNALDNIRKEAEETARKLIIETEEEITETKPEVKKPAIEINANNVNTENLYLTLVEALNDDCKEVLRLILTGSDCNIFLRERGLLPEVAAEAINEAALEITGDILLEDGLEVIEDYKEDLTRAINEHS
jgi:hypothetical protein